ncbi:aldehyde dehydrogenase family protein [Methylobacterium phyllostachyos]|uniref:aldehyde dehydrogenase family protein n=1 Tax=Methylobacterium phyllostachyos TaxID=582672 RepID=UPI001FCD8C1A
MAAYVDPEDESLVSRDEIFGPVLKIHAIEEAEEAVRRANGTDFGLGASLWTRDLDHGMNLSRRIKAGTVWINAHVVIDLAMPFGASSNPGSAATSASFGSMPIRKPSPSASVTDAR